MEANLERLQKFLLSVSLPPSFPNAVVPLSQHTFCAKPKAPSTLKSLSDNKPSLTITSVNNNTSNLILYPLLPPSTASNPLATRNNATTEGRITTGNFPNVTNNAKECYAACNSNKPASPNVDSTVADYDFSTLFLCKPDTINVLKASLVTILESIIAAQLPQYLKSGTINKAREPQ